MQSLQLDGVFEVYEGSLLGRFASTSLPYACEGVTFCEAEHGIWSNCFEVRVLLINWTLFCFVFFHMDKSNWRIFEWCFIYLGLYPILQKMPTILIFMLHPLRLYRLTARGITCIFLIVFYFFLLWLGWLIDGDQILEL